MLTYCAAGTPLKPEPSAEMLGTPAKPGQRELFFLAGAEEFWTCDEAGRILFYTSAGTLDGSALCPRFPSQV